MKYAFIDYENVHSLSLWDLADFEKIFLFIGANQKAIELSSKFEDELNITLITIKSVAKNNLDFHLTYYLGKLDAQTDKQIAFHIFSNDKGYEGICEFISKQKQGRECRLIGMYVSKSEKKQPEKSELYQKYLHFLLSKPHAKRPQTLTALKNEILSYLALKNTPNKVEFILRQLSEARQIEIIGKTVVYQNE